jgi:ABC-2 type transport system permease protein
MNSVWPIVKKELRTYFNSPMAYISVLVFLILSGVWLFFFQRFFAQDNSSLRAFFVIMPAAFTVLVPAITMRLWAEERKMGTIEILSTMPFGEWTLAAAKFLSAFFLLALMVLLTLPVPIMIGFLGRLDPGQIVGEYLGVLFMGAASVAIGSYLSSLTKNQITAFIVSVIILFFLFFAGQIAIWLSVPAAVGGALRWISINYHFESFEKGVLDTRDLLYFGLVAAGFLFLTAKTLLFRKWR